MAKSFLIIASFFGLLAVVMGAFAAHGLENVLSAEQINTFQTGVRYQFYHTFALLFIALLAKQDPMAILKWAAGAFTIGVILFSGSIYLLACRELLGISHWTWLGPVTPLGGTFLIAGWGLLLAFAFKWERK